MGNDIALSMYLSFTFITKYVHVRTNDYGKNRDLISKIRGLPFCSEVGPFAFLSGSLLYRWMYNPFVSRLSDNC